MERVAAASADGPTKLTPTTVTVEDSFEAGQGAGEGYPVNVPLPPGTGDRGYAYAFEAIVEPIMEAFDPGFLLVSAGQDPGVVDPTARNMVTMAGFRDLSRRICRLVAGWFGLVQEDGYQLGHLPFATLGALAGRSTTSPASRTCYCSFRTSRVQPGVGRRRGPAHWPLDRP